MRVFKRVLTLVRQIIKVFSPIILTSCLGSNTIAPSVQLDRFGITQLYASSGSGMFWDSGHWAGRNYLLDSRIDSFDPFAVSGYRGDGMLSVADGELSMFGPQPRLYIYSRSVDHPWQNLEVTFYYKRVEDADVAWAGAVVGVRSGEEGHSADVCSAHTYYARLRNDGAADFEKELKHPASSTGQRIEPEVVWPDFLQVPYNKWIGIKFVVLNNPSNQVELYLYRDMSGGLDGGNWELLNAFVDTGSNWSVETDCTEHRPVENRSSQPIVAGGAVFIRNTDVTAARYKWLSVREISADVAKRNMIK